ncbi:hypothetical protein ACQ4PT_060784 [Festuca glaucescens]
MNNSGGGGGLDPARGNGPGRGRGDRYNGPGRGGGCNGPANGAGFNGQPANNSGRGGGYNNRFFGGGNGRQGNFVAGESSGTADDRDDGQGQSFPAEFGSDFSHFNRGSNFNNHNRNGGNQQYRPRNYGNNNFNSNNQNGYNGGRSNFNQYRNNGGGSIDPVIQNGASLAGISPDLLKEAMQGVVATLAAAAQRGGAEGIPNSVSIVAPTAGQSVAPVMQQPQALVPGPQQAQPMQLDSATLPKPDAPNPAKKAKKAEKNPCFRCKQPGHQIDTCTAPVCDILIVTQLGSDGMDSNGGNNGGGDNNGSNGDNRDGANDMDIEKAVNNEQQGNGNNQKGNVKNVNNGKGVVGHQVQHQFEDPIFGSLNRDLLSKEKDNVGAPFQVDPAPGSMKIRPVSAPGSERPVAAGSSPLPLGSQSPAGATSVVAATSPGAASSPTRHMRSPLSPTCPQLLSALSATARVAPPMGGIAPAVELGLITASPSCTPEKLMPVPPSLSPVTRTVVGPGRDGGHLRTEEQHGSPAAGFFGSSAATQSMISSVSSKKNTGISIVVDMENSPSPTVVTRQFPGTPMATVTDFEGKTKRTPLVDDVAVFGGIASPSLSNVRASDRIRAQPNADATQMERAMQNVNLRQDYASPGNGKSKPSLSSLYDDDIIVKASRLGISLGKNKKEVSKAVKSIKDVDFNRTLVILKKNVEDQLDKEEGQNSLLTSKISSLTGDLIIEEAQELLE